MEKQNNIKVFVSGCTGRMGSLVVDTINQHSNWTVCGGLSSCMKKISYDFSVFDIGSCRAATFFSTSHPDIIIDFSTPIVAEYVYKNYASYYGIPMVCATTKLSSELITEMKQEKTIPVFQSYNLAYDVYVFTKAVADIVSNLHECDIDIKEVHHKNKKDAPSGTAMNLAEAINRALGYTHEINLNPCKNLRKPNEIHVHSERRGSYAGTHTVYLTVANKYTITLEHEAISSKIFVDGAIKAAEFLLTQPAGYYTMDNL